MMNQQVKELNRLNNKLEEQLDEENREAYTDIICYLRVSNISEYNQEIIRQDLLEMILSAQERGENIQTVIGEDYKAFCNNIIASLPPRGVKEKILEFLDILLLGTSLLGTIHIILSKDTISLIRNALSGETLNFQIGISIGSLIAYCIIIAASIIIVHAIGKASFKPKPEKKRNKVRDFSIGAGIMAFFLFLAWIGKAVLFTVNIFAACAFVLVLYISHRILSRNL
ncbi:MAG: DUF1129 domain-containing protein [Oscillospiraceae bacterium]